MSNITRNTRSKGWNVQFVIGSYAFAGIYQRDNLVTIGDVARDLDLCVVFNGVHNGSGGDGDDWCPALLPRMPSSDVTQPIILDKTSAKPLPASGAGVTQYSYLYHSASRCAGLTHGLESSCYRKPPLPKRRYNAHYAAIKKPSYTSSKLIMAPVRSRKRPSSTSPLASRNPSLASSSTDENNDREEIPISIIPVAEGQALIRSFRHDSVSPSSMCAISGLGRSWNAMLPGTGLEAAHIVPQIHWSVYPYGGPVDSAEPSVEDRSRLEMAWRLTWSSSNGLPLMSQLHKCFDARLVSIHPQTGRVRAWVNYDVLTQHHGHQANMPALTDPNALQHQYDMCCIENMVAAWVPAPEPAPPSPFGRPVAQRQYTEAPARREATDGRDVAPSDRGDAPDDSTPPTSNHAANSYATYPPSPPSSNTRTRWLCGAELIEDPEVAATYLKHGWILTEISDFEQVSDGDKEQEERGRSRKRRCDATPSVDEQEERGGSHKTRRYSTPSVDGQGSKSRRRPGAQLSPDRILGGA